MANLDTWTYLYNPALMTITLKLPTAASTYMTAEVRAYGSTGWGKWKWSADGTQTWLAALTAANLNDEAVMLRREHRFHCFFSSSDGAGQDGVYFEIANLDPMIPGTTARFLFTSRSTDGAITQVTDLLLNGTIV